MSVQRTYDPICPFLAPVQCHKGRGLGCPGLDMSRLAHLDTSQVLGGEQIASKKSHKPRNILPQTGGKEFRKSCDESIG